ncbi:FAD/NAD(P)-binding domain-containing protein [Pyrenophora tritici-repentis]|nr:FAD/NAD(P)-binding domain-containing protein [Pyrenophora tritici-repentis]
MLRLPFVPRELVSRSSGGLHGNARTGALVGGKVSEQRRAITIEQLDKARNDRERVVVLGSGWAGFTVARTLDSSKYQALVISPRSYFAFTPLLASTAVGTLEFRTALEPVRSRRTKVEFIQGWADDVDFKNKTITIEQAVDDARQITVGCYSQTFGTPGVKEHAFFLKDVGDARKIRNRILACFEGAALPTTSVEMKKQLLNFAVVGGGPTGIEFSAELHDLINEDMRRLYPELIQYHNITVYDVAEKVLPMFDKKLADYAMQKFKREGIQIKTSHHVEELRPGAPAERSQPYDVGQEYLYTLKVKEEGEIGVGMCVWSTGLMQNPFVASALSDVREAPTNLHIPSPTSDPATVSPSSVKWVVKKDAKSGSIITDDHLRVKLVPESSFSDSKDSKNASIEAIHPDVFALGDCGIIESTSYPATAQVASQKAFWLAKRFNKADINSDIDPQPSPASSSLNPTTTTKGFTYRDLGTLAYIGNWNALFQGGVISQQASHPCHLDDEIVALSLQLEEINYREETKKAKYTPDNVPDLEVAYASYLTEIETHLAFLKDVKLAHSIANAVDADAEVIAELAQVETQAQEDRRVAVQMSSDDPDLEAPPPYAEVVRDDSIENEVVRRMTALLSSEHDAHDDLENEAGLSVSYTQRQADAMGKLARNQFECIACREEFRFADITHIGCDSHHQYCSSCLKQFIMNGVVSHDLAYLPPRCCGKEVSRSIILGCLTAEELEDFTNAEIEKQTPVKTYCSNSECGRFIAPCHIAAGEATCPRCRTKTCTTCNSPQHEGDCPADSSLQAILDLGAENQWCRCFSCRSMVAIEWGCNHMT